MKKYIVILGLGLAASLIILLLSRVEGLENTLDWRFKLRGERKGSDEIIIVYVEEGIRARMARSFYALLIGICAEEAGAIGLDLSLDESNPEQDEELEEALRELEETAKIYLAFGKGTKATTSNQIRELEESAWEIDSNLRGRLITLKEAKIAVPLSKFCRYSSGVGHVYPAKKNPEDIIRKVPLLIEHGGKIYPLLALQVLRDYLGVDVESTDVKLGKHIKLVTREGEIKIPIDKKARMLVNYIGGKERFENSFTLSQFIEKQPRIDKRHIVLVGARVEKDEKGKVIEGKDDAHRVPFCSGYPGVAIHANIIDNILKRQFLRPAGIATNTIVFLLLGLMIGGIVGTSRRRGEEEISLFRSVRSIRGMLLTIFLSAAYLGITLVFFKFYSVWINVAAPLIVMLVMIFGYFLIGIYKCDLELKDFFEKAGKENVYRFLRFCLAGIIVIVWFIIVWKHGFDLSATLLLCVALLVAGISIDDLIRILNQIRGEKKSEEDDEKSTQIPEEEKDG